jgi:hypothetical protein
MGPKYVVIKKGEHGALLFHDQNVFCASIAIRKYLIQQELEILLQEDLQVLLRSENVSLKT